MKFESKFSLHFCLYFFLTGLKSFSQDVIILKNGDEILSKVIEVSTDIIKYKKWDNQDGPIYTSNKGEIFMIKYQNGTKDVFNTTQTQAKTIPIDNSSKIIEIAKSFMNNQISSESKGACKLVEFNKQNGVEKEIFGQKIYTLEYRLIIESQKDFWKESKDKLFGANWYWTNFSVLDEKGDVYAEQFTNNYKYFTKGMRIEITGVIDFENTDNGWRMSGVNTFSAGYENKTSKILSNISSVSPNPAKPELKKPEVPIDTTDEKYIGEYKDEKRNGQGKMVYKNGDVYQGEWKDGKRNGQGKLHIFNEGITYEGEWKDDNKEGFGTLTWDDGYVNYQGEFKNGLPDGYGTTYDKGIKVYEGGWKNGKKSGKGVLNYITKEFSLYYEGYFVNDVFNGQGINKVILDDGTIIVTKGDFINGALEGEGTEVINYTDGTIATFTGEFKDKEKFNGILYITTPTGKKGSIEYKNGIKGRLVTKK